MGIYTIRRKSFREIARFTAIDQEGRSHVVVERAAMLNDVGAGGKVIDSQRGASSFYSATTGDAVAPLPDGSFAAASGNGRLVLKRSG
jgi:hypothetical protein